MQFRYLGTSHLKRPVRPSNGELHYSLDFVLIEVTPSLHPTHFLNPAKQPPNSVSAIQRSSNGFWLESFRASKRLAAITSSRAARLFRYSRLRQSPRRPANAS